MLLSVIIPLYNTEKYIAKCLDSILEQGLTSGQYEIIVVNDGSTDSGLQIVGEYCNQYQNIRLISQENAGVSAARNHGLKEAKGEYVHFVDSDDYMEAGAYSHIFNVLLKGKTDYDIIKFHSITVDKYADVEKATNIAESRIIYEGEHYEQILKYGAFSTFVWNLFIRKSVLLENKIYFPTDIIVCEDIIFNLDLATIKGLKVMLCNTNAYRYVLRENSAVSSWSERHLNVYLKSCELVQDSYRLREQLFDDRFSKCFHKLFVGVSRLVGTRLLSSKIGVHKMKQQIQKYYDLGIFPIQDNSRAHRILNALTRHPKFFYIAGLLYRNIFLPYFKRFVPRN